MDSAAGTRLVLRKAMRNRPLFYSAILGGLTLFMYESPASACSGPMCGDVAVVGSIGFKPAMGSIPANTPAIGVGFGDARQKVEGPLTLELKETAGSTTREVAITWDANENAFVLSGPLTPGSSVELEGIAKGFSYLEEAEPSCEFPMRGQWQVTAEAALPTELGTLSATYEERKVSMASGASCSEKVLASTAIVRVAHAAAAEPWRDVLVYETRVDGKAWQPSISTSSLQTPSFSFDEGLPNFVPGGSSIAEARGEDWLVTKCPGEISTEGRYLEPGKHSVEMRARVPGSDVLLSTGVIEIDLPPCEGTDGEDGGTGAEPGASRPDGSAGGTDVDGSSPLEDGTDAAVEDANDQKQRKSSGGCSVMPWLSSEGSTAAGWTALLCGLVIHRRRRAR